MKKKLLAILSVCLLMGAGSAYAVLPPLYHSSQEIQGMLQDPQLGEHLGAEQMIQSIRRTHDGFIIRTQEKKIKVKAKLKPQSQPGPAKWSYEFKEAKSLEH